MDVTRRSGYPSPPTSSIFLPKEVLPAYPARSTKDSESFSYVDPDQREKALGYIRKWLGATDGQELTIHDPYLLPNDVAAILKMVLETRPELDLTFITSKVGLQRADISPRATPAGDTRLSTTTLIRTEQC
jgi:hypothetical protein